MPSLGGPSATVATTRAPRIRLAGTTRPAILAENEASVVNAEALSELDPQMGEP
jgi:hypothetical protein